MSKKRRKRPTPIPPGSGLEDTFARLWEEYGGVLPPPVREYKFLPARKFRFDFAWPDLLVAVEIHGGQWQRGRHVRGKGFRVDCDKWNLATLDGWRMLHYTTDHMTNRPVQTVEETVKFLRRVMRDGGQPKGDQGS